MKRRIMLSGVHGVGKGYFLKNNFINIPDIVIMSASDIISKYRSSDDGMKRVDNVSLNQEILYNNVKAMIRESNCTFVLDGHLIILSNDDSLERIPTCFFEKGMFDTLFLIQDNPYAIQERLLQRDGFSKLNVKTIEMIQTEELNYSQELKKQGIDVVHLTPDSPRSVYYNYLV